MASSHVAAPHWLARLIFLVLFIQVRSSAAGFSRRSPRKVDQETEKSGQEFSGQEVGKKQEESAPETEEANKSTVVVAESEPTSAKHEVASDAPPVPAQSRSGNADLDHGSVGPSNVEGDDGVHSSHAPSLSRDLNACLAREERDQAIATHYRDLVLSLEDKMATFVRRERSWERTISELVAQRDLLERREGAWERTIDELVGDIEVRARQVVHIAINL